MKNILIVFILFTIAIGCKKETSEPQVKVRDVEYNLKPINPSDSIAGNICVMKTINGVTDTIVSLTHFNSAQQYKFTTQTGCKIKYVITPDSATTNPISHIKIDGGIQQLILNDLNYEFYL